LLVRQRLALGSSSQGAFGEIRALNRTRRKFKFIDHTADMGIQVYGETLSLLFQHAAEGLLHIITDPERIREKESREISLRAGGLEELLVNWLNELIYLFETGGFLFRRFEILHLGESFIEAVAFGEIFDEGYHPILRTVKATTYHQLRVTKGEAGWEAQVIFDLW
jgi:SHS2 domain-containing protein